MLGPNVCVLHASTFEAEPQVDGTMNNHADCGAPVYNADFDDLCCEKCDEWLSPKCLDPECNYCWKRPDKPSQALQKAGP